MYIYKITNKINNKIYIGQVYNKSIYDRFERHIKCASANSKSYIARAIYKYGKENFVIEQIDEASSLQELNEKEKYWIKYYQSFKHENGYNLTLGGDGGNTYLCKTEAELKEIKDKISKANSGKNNGLSKSFKAFNINTNEELFFDTLCEGCKYFNVHQKYIFVSHCEGLAKRFWRQEWTFAYTENEYDLTLNKNKYDRSCNKGNKVKLKNNETGEEIIFNSQNKCLEYLGLTKRDQKYKNNIWEFKQYTIIKLV